MIQESVKNMKLNGVLAHMSISLVGPDKAGTVANLWNNYVSLELGHSLDYVSNERTTTDSREEEMMAEYLRIQHVRPKLEMDERGFYVVSGMNI